MRITKSSPKNTIGARLKEIRLNARITQKEMGEIVGLTAGAIGAMENNAYTPNYDVLRAIKSKLNVPYSFIIDGNKEPEGSNPLLIENKKLRSEVERLNKIVDKLLKS